MPDNTDRDPGGIPGLTRGRYLGWTFHVQWVRHCVSMPFTCENAKELGDKGREARKRNKLARDAMPQPAIEVPVDYAEKTKLRVRGMLERACELFDHERDANKIDRLASAVAKLAELDRQLSGRPLPGTLRPAVKAREKWSDIDLPKAPAPVLAPEPDDAPAPDIAPEPRPANVLSDGPARDVFHVEQPESTSV